MFVNTLMKRCVFLLISTILSLILLIYFFHSIFFTNSIIISYSVHPFDLCSTYPTFWYYFKITYLIFYFISTFICSNTLYSLLFTKTQTITKNSINFKKNSLSLFIGYNDSQEEIFIPEKGLYQNILVTGTIGSGKTSSALYPFTRQLLEYKCNSKEEKIGFLILDVKGNYYKEVEKYVRDLKREDDLKIIQINR